MTARVAAILRRRAGVVAFAVIAAALTAQDPEQARNALSKAQRELQQVRGETESLLDARIRYDLGLPVADLACFRNEVPATTASTERQQQRLAEEDAATTTLLTRYEKLRQQVQQFQAEAAKQTQEQRREEEWVTVPVPGGSNAPRRRPDPEQVAVPLAAPGVGAEARASEPVRVVPNLDPIRAQIQGSSDRGLVAQALYRASQALMDRAADLRARGQTVAADQADDEAKQRLLRAISELESVTRAGTPAFADLFHLGKCRELMFRIAERRDGLSLVTDPKAYQKREQEVRDPFVAITARDVVTRAGAEQPGPWARAAQVALDHFRWMNLHAGFAPKVDPAAITWTNQAKR